MTNPHKVEKLSGIEIHLLCCCDYLCKVCNKPVASCRFVIVFEKEYYHRDCFQKADVPEKVKERVKDLISKEVFETV